MQVTCLHAGFSQDIVVATSYATLGADSVVKAVVQGGVVALICNRKTVSKLLKAAGEMPTLQYVIYTDHLCTPAEIAASPPSAEGSSIGVYSVEQVVDMGKNTPCKPTPPSPDSLAVLMYTSGSTGDPKGVMVLQRNLIALIAAVKIQFAGVRGKVGTDVYLGYLPLAHILEMVSEFYTFCVANPVGYADPKSLLAGPERCYPTGAFETFRPALMCGVPKVWEGIRSGALAKVQAKGALASFLIGLAVRMKALAEKQRRYTPLFKKLLATFKKTTGGNLKAALSGGGAISAEVQEWCRTALDCPLMQGYGLTETTGGCTIQMPDDMSIGIAGTPLSSVEITLHSEAEITDANGAPYLATDLVHANGDECAGRGEVWIRGSNLTAGYYKMPQLTSEEYDAKGWFHTGDIGMLTPGGALRIIDRKKNLVKLKGGEYVALERMNTAYNASSFVNVDAGGVCCYADDSLDRSICVAQCKPSELRKAAEKVGVSLADDEALCNDPNVQAEVLDSFKAAAKAAKLTSLETIVAVRPVIADWCEQWDQSHSPARTTCGLILSQDLSQDLSQAIVG
uniref:AMP-dependent synthetase/ligase domain-containing protein n=1 Tax=Haptolina brevifila TaxID=156173 RepID=A0A7S2BF27_9EUKA|mmetsp:Transcript_12369/g.24832  ORF Transcript_12369/g.24832 Transcript_12369/m.24832 type:complete len:568 (+) Transcript_12369:897-2600(+)